MNDVIGYGGTRVVVTGCASGMGLATARLLLELGAEVHGLDVRPAELGLASFRHLDLRDPASIESTAPQLDGPSDALFNCAGLGPTFSPLDIVKVNFFGTRMLTEQLLAKYGEGAGIGSIASTAGMAWSRRIGLHKNFIAAGAYKDALAWAEAHPDEIGKGYVFSKEAVRLDHAAIPAPDPARHPDQLHPAGPDPHPDDDRPDRGGHQPGRARQVVQPVGRPATPEEQAFVLVMTNSPRASFLNGAAINVDGGRLAGLTVG